MHACMHASSKLAASQKMIYNAQDEQEGEEELPNQIANMIMVRTYSHVLVVPVDT